MNEEKEFFKTCFNTVVGLEVKNESQAIAKEVVLSEIKNLQQENRKQKEVIDRILNETKETRNILNNNRADNMLSKGCLLSYLGIVEDLLSEVSE